MRSLKSCTPSFKLKRLITLLSTFSSDQLQFAWYSKESPMRICPVEENEGEHRCNYIMPVKIA